MWWLVVLIGLVAGIARSDTPKISYPAIPDWVRPVAWTDSTNRLLQAASEGSRYLLYEDQQRPKSSESFSRVILLMENENGVQDSGSLRFGFDPEYQELQLHRVVIHRDGRTINCLNPAKVRLIQPERELDDHMFTGEQTAVLFVEDLRVGDALEYAYTVRGANPIFEGHFSDRFFIQSGFPVERELYRVVWDDAKPLVQNKVAAEHPAVVQPWGNGREYIWNFTNLAAIPYEDRKPASCEPYPYIELSDFPDWASVVKWAQPLYDVSPTNIPAEMQNLVARWNRSARSSEEKARLALQFVQDDLRYTGIELGPDSYRPAGPVETFEKRYGDCKGKVVLLRCLLQQLGIESDPALLNSFSQAAVANRLPSPFAFNHVILKINLDGRTAWVDPTISHQGGLVWIRYLPPYSKALVIRPGSDALEDIPPIQAENANQQIATSTFSIKDYIRPVAFTVRTEYCGANADDMRDEVASTATDKLAKNYLNFYTRLYPGIAAAAPLKITDDRFANTVVLEEAYTITNLWTRSDSGKLWVAEFNADYLFNMLADPQTRQRKTPLALRFPLSRQQDVIVHLPDSDWQIPGTGTNVEHEAFSFGYGRKLQGSTVTFHYECHTKLAELPPELVPSYLAKRKQMENLLTDTLQRPVETGTASGINWLMVVIAMFGAGFTAAAGIWYACRAVAATRRPTGLPPVLSFEDPKLNGLGGWLILVGFGLCLAPFIRIGFLVQNWDSYFSIQVWQAVAMPQGRSYHALYGPLLMFELLGNIVVMGLNLLALFLFFSKRSAFPRVFITLALIHAVFLIMDDIGAAQIHSIQSGGTGGDFRDAYRATFYAIIWSSYMVKSRRVKATFIK